MKTLNFSRVDKAKFFRTLNKRVNTYFKENNIKRTGNWKLYTKAIIMFSLFLIPFLLVLTVFYATMGNDFSNGSLRNRNGRCWNECNA